VARDVASNPDITDIDDLSGPAIAKLRNMGVHDFNSFEENEEKILRRHMSGLGKGVVIKITEKYRKRRRNRDEDTDTESGVRRIGGDSYQLSHHG
jgi:hypothetical protein